MTAYYNENDPVAAQWLRNLISEGHIARGDVDERSIRDVQPGDLEGYAQCHFFAGIGGWSLALRMAGWPDERSVWTGSCPCQPFSAAGKKTGFDDERHLWPEFHRLIHAGRPAIVFGEQVASPDGLAWWDTVQDDLEGTDYTPWAADLCAAGVGAPNIRQRLFWLAYAASIKRGRVANGERRIADGPPPRREQSNSEPEPSGSVGGVADSPASGRLEERTDRGRGAFGNSPQGIPAGPRPGSGDLWSDALNGFWRNADWLLCRDGKWRAVEPGTFPLDSGVPGRVGQLRGYGNAISPQVAAEFIGAFIDVIDG